jgi:hypothetical protein
VAEHIKKRKDKTATPEYRDNYDRIFRQGKERVKKKRSNPRSSVKFIRDNQGDLFCK